MSPALRLHSYQFIIRQSSCHSIFVAQATDTVIKQLTAYQSVLLPYNTARLFQILQTDLLVNQFNGDFGFQGGGVR
jgi:hypothetical protein